MDWGLRIRKDVPNWAFKLVLVVAILLIAGLQRVGVL
jgi:hypothetical protein